MSEIPLYLVGRYVTMSVSLPLSAAEFNSVQAAFVSGVAAAAGVAAK